MSSTPYLCPKCSAKCTWLWTLPTAWYCHVCRKEYPPRPEDGGNNGEHRTADQEASGGAPQQSYMGGPPTEASTAQHLAYVAQQRAIANALAYGAQQGTGLMPLGGGLNAREQAAFLQAMQAPQNAANQWAGTFWTSGGPFMSGLAQQGWVDPYPLPPLENAGISAGEIIGHRVWRYNAFARGTSDCGPYLLQSMAMDTIWPPDGPMHDPEVEDHNGHGIHAFKRQESVLNEYAPANHWGATKLVYGTVALWGAVIEHERGYRGEFARIHSLNSIPQLYRWKELRLLRDLRQRYGLGGQ